MQTASTPLSALQIGIQKLADGLVSGSAANRIRSIELHALQAEIYNHPARFKVVVCGRRVGKTELAKFILKERGQVTDLPYAYFAPTYKMQNKVWNSVKTALYPIIQRVSEKDKHLQLVSGATIDFWSLDNPDGARGQMYAEVIIDEAAVVAKLEYAWNEVIRPTLTDLQGAALFLSTPKGRNFFWQLFNRGHDPLFPDWMCWQQPSTSNPHLPPDEIESARIELPERSFRQEYLAEFLEDGGSVFRGVALVSTALPAEPMPGHSYVMGVDWGKSDDFTAISVYDETANCEVHLERFNQISWALQRGRLIALVSKYKPRLIIAELNSIGEPNVEALRSERLPIEGFTMTAASKTPLVDALALAIENQEIKLLNDAVGTHELQSYEMERLPSGIWRYNAPEGGHDDTVVCRMLMWNAHLQRPRVATIAQWSL